MLPQKIRQISKKEANQDGENDKKKKKNKVMCRIVEGTRGYLK